MSSTPSSSDHPAVRAYRAKLRKIVIETAPIVDSRKVVRRLAAQKAQRERLESRIRRLASAPDSLSKTAPDDEDLIDELEEADEELMEVAAGG